MALQRQAGRPPAGLGFVPLGTTFLVDALDALLVSVEVVFVQSSGVRGWSA